MLKEISQNGTAVIMATHNHTLVEKYPGTVYKCEHGRLEDITKSYHDFRLADEPRQGQHRGEIHGKNGNIKKRNKNESYEVWRHSPLVHRRE